MAVSEDLTKLSDELRRLSARADMRDKGLITSDEYEAKKADLLARR